MQLFFKFTAGNRALRHNSKRPTSLLPSKTKENPHQPKPRHFMRYLQMYHALLGGCKQTLTENTSAPKNKYQKTQIISKTKEEMLQNQFNKVEVIPQTNTSPVTNIGQYAHTQKQKTLFHLRAKGKNLCRRLFGKQRNNSIIFHCNLLCHQTRNPGKMNSKRKLLRPTMNPHCGQMTGTTDPATNSQKKIFHTLTGVIPITCYKNKLLTVILHTTINQSTQHRERTHVEVLNYTCALLQKQL